MPASKPFLSLILPVHNESRRMPDSLREILAFLSSQTYTWEIIIVENASTDNTLERAQEYENTVPNLRVIHLDLPGKGLAVKTGMLLARGEYRFFADIDLSMPITEINHFLPPVLSSLDVAIASREIHGAARYNEPALRHITGRVFNSLVRWIALPGLNDTQCGFKCFRGEVAEKVFSRQTLTGWSFDAEVLAISRALGFSIQEVPINWYYNSNSRVHLIRDSFKMLMDLFRIRRNIRNGLYS